MNNIKQHLEGVAQRHPEIVAQNDRETICLGQTSRRSVAERISETYLGSWVVRYGPGDFRVLAPREAYPDERGVTPIGHLEGEER